ncbi:MAG: ferrous iron transport protein B [Gammaproteobacteria bacterium PRO9]|nr:ferrous iron transport protein B [Gammaproteobacteria bacterium PRO9]
MSAVLPDPPVRAAQATAQHGRSIALIGNPNTGKSTLFNVLTGLRQKTANYPGVTVERHTGELRLGNERVSLIDLPGAYSLAAHSLDEMVAIDVLLGHISGAARPDVVLAVVDATNLRRNLFLVTQLAELGLPLVVALNLSDVAEARGIHIDAEALGRELHASVVPVSAGRGTGMVELRAALAQALQSPPPAPLRVLPELGTAAADLAARARAAGASLSDYEVERALIDVQGAAEHRFQVQAPKAFHAELTALRDRLKSGASLAQVEATARYRLINGIVSRTEQRDPPRLTFADRLDRITNHPVIGSVLFLLVMAAVFQAVFSWATPMMELIDHATSLLSEMVRATLPAGALTSLIVDGVIAGVGSVVVFLPQILILFAFIIFLEDSGYMPRVAFMVDRLMRAVGLSGQSFIPMLSGFACAVPGIMATRVIPDPRDRLATILAAPFMTCSARLPVYALLIAAFIPPEHYLGGWVNLQGLVLLGLYLLGIVGGVLTALLMKRTILRGPTPTFMIELPPYRWPNWKSVLLKLAGRGKIFLVRAGTVIFGVAIVIWALVYFPRPAAIGEAFAAERAVVVASGLPADERDSRLAALDAAEASQYLEDSWLGQLGHFIEPAFKPLGWDWKVAAAVIASFPAREVVIAVMGTIYSVGSQADDAEDALRDRLKTATRPDGSLVYTMPMAIGLLIFYAFCLQCAATIAVMRRETNTWRWPLFAWCYMTGLGYLGAMLAFQLGSA